LCLNFLATQKIGIMKLIHLNKNKSANFIIQKLILSRCPTLYLLDSHNCVIEIIKSNMKKHFREGE